MRFTELSFELKSANIDGKQQLKMMSYENDLATFIYKTRRSEPE